MDELTQYHWTGNVRELENVIERAMIISRGSKLDLGDSLRLLPSTAKNQGLISLAENERAHILKALEFTNWKVSGKQGAANLLDINRTTLEARMKKLDIQRP
jgi:transcriptional regulator of acetoin/glycerol metabolism